jgi:hypothetical protein
MPGQSSEAGLHWTTALAEGLDNSLPYGLPRAASCSHGTPAFPERSRHVRMPLRGYLVFVANIDMRGRVRQTHARTRALRDARIGTTNCEREFTVALGDQNRKQAQQPFRYLDRGRCRAPPNSSPTSTRRWLPPWPARASTAPRRPLSIFGFGQHSAQPSSATGPRAAGK